MSTQTESDNYFALICEGELTTISGLPLFKMIFPETATVRPCIAAGEKIAQRSRRGSRPQTPDSGICLPCSGKCGPWPIDKPHPPYQLPLQFPRHVSPLPQPCNLAGPERQPKRHISQAAARALIWFS